MVKAKKAVKRKGKLPLVHKIIVDRVLKVCARDPRNRYPSVKYPTLSMDKMRRVLSIIFHIPKELHYNVIREFEEYRVLRVDHGRVKVLLRAKNPGKKKAKR